jgi:hypothetical protein
VSAGKSTGKVGRAWAFAIIGLLVAIVGLGIYSYGVFSSSGKNNVVEHFSSSGKFYAVDTSDKSSAPTPTCVVKPDNGAAVTETIPKGHFKQGMNGKLYSVDGPATVTCTGTDLFVLKGPAAYVAAANVKTIIGWVGLIVFLLAIRKVAQLRKNARTASV